MILYSEHCLIANVSIVVTIASTAIFGRAPLGANKHCL